MLRSIKATILLGLLGWIAGCGQVMNPYLMLPAKPLRQNQFQVAGSIGGLPSLGEVTPSSTWGAIGLLRYGITDRFSLQGELWTNNIIHFYNTGISLEGVELLSDSSSQFHIALIPRVVMMNNGIHPKGWGISASLATWYPKLFGLTPYLGIGVLAGAAAFNDSSVSQYANGYGEITNVGLSYEFTHGVSINGEIAVPVIYDIHNHSYYVWAVPELAIEYRF